MIDDLLAPILTCAPNFRDIGGYDAADGAKVRKGRIYRSQLIVGPGEADLAALRGIGIRYICDLRGAHEAKASPDRWVDEPPPVLRHLDIGMDVRAGSRQLLEIATADPTPNGIRKMMMHTYSLLPRAFEGRLGLLLDDIVESDPFPALVHCTAGKDRTGFVTAMLLLTLGVPLETVHHDYALTEMFSDMDRMMAASAAYLRSITGDRLQPDREMLRMLCGTSPDYLDAALAAIARDYGSVEQYLETTAGFGAAKRETLRNLMLE